MMKSPLCFYLPLPCGRGQLRVGLSRAPRGVAGKRFAGREHRTVRSRLPLPCSRGQAWHHARHRWRHRVVRAVWRQTRGQGGGGRWGLGWAALGAPAWQRWARPFPARPGGSCSAQRAEAAGPAPGRTTSPRRGGRRRCVCAERAARLGSAGLGAAVTSRLSLSQRRRRRCRRSRGSCRTLRWARSSTRSPRPTTSWRVSPSRAGGTGGGPHGRVEDAMPPRCGAGAARRVPALSQPVWKGWNTPPRPGEASCAAGRPFSASCHNSGVVGREGGPGRPYVKGIVGTAGPRCHAGRAPTGSAGGRQGTGVPGPAVVPPLLTPLVPPGRCGGVGWGQRGPAKLLQGLVACKVVWWCFFFVWIGSRFVTCNCLGSGNFCLGTSLSPWSIFSLRYMLYSYLERLHRVDTVFKGKWGGVCFSPLRGVRYPLSVLAPQKESKCSPAPGVST